MRTSRVVIAAALGLYALFAVAPASAGLPVPPIPKLVVPAPPPVVLVPGTYVYFAADLDGDLLFHHGYWYRPYGGRWYRSNSYDGPWGFISIERVPSVIIDLPRGYRTVPPGHQRIPYGQLKSNWSTWEREKHWDRHEHSVHAEKHAGKNDHRERRSPKKRHSHDNREKHRASEDGGNAGGGKKGHGRGH